MIYQMHPDHGRHLAISNVEAEINEKNGWKTVTEQEFYAEIRERTEVPADDLDRNALAREYEEKFGKKPHHNMAASTIKDKLDV